MKWFDRWFVRKCKWAWENKHLANDYPAGLGKAINMPAPSVSAGPDQHNMLSARGMHFTVYNAEGGIVIEFTSYDPTTDRRSHRLYIVPDSDNWGEQIAKCVTMESLRQH